jgi:hypothetical protein
MAAAGVAVVVAAAAVPFFPTTFLPPFNEGTLLIGLRLNPGVTLAETSALARQAEVLVSQVPEVTHVGRRSGRAELDEHAEGRARQRTRCGPETHRPVDAHDGRDQGRHPRAADQPARRAGDRPAYLAPHRPHALGCAFADRHQDLRRGPGRTARSGRRAACEAGRHPPASPICRSKSRCWRRRSRCVWTTPPRPSTACPRPRC